MKTVTIVCADDREPEYGLRVVVDTLSKMPVPCKGILFTSKLPAGRVGGVEIINCKLMRNLTDYSDVCLRGMNPYIDTDTVLVVQWDGFILYPSKFEEEFFEYDYIGSPAYWTKGPNRVLEVGNGGFSVRSKKLLEVFAKTTDQVLWEDKYICHDRKDLFRNNGLVMAPLDVADRFAHDTMTEDKEQWGFHNFPGLKKKCDTAWRLNVYNLLNRDASNVTRINNALKYEAECRARG